MTFSSPDVVKLYDSAMFASVSGGNDIEPLAVFKLTPPNAA
jgi:hypothetical protein